VRLTQEIAARLRQPTVERRIGQLIAGGEIRRAVDLGCGVYSPLTKFRPSVWTLGVDASSDAISDARKKDLFDEYLVADVTADNFVVQCRALGPFDLVVAIDIVEHLPKRIGLEFVESCELLSSKFVVIQTPNGFVEQGPEDGTDFQRHRSGWYEHDLAGMGYSVRGTTGTRILRGYGAGLRVNTWLVSGADALLARLLWTESFPRYAFNLIAIKDVRGRSAKRDSRGGAKVARHT
jgi:hypothetical protein